MTDLMQLVLRADDGRQGENPLPLTPLATLYGNSYRIRAREKYQLPP